MPKDGLYTKFFRFKAVSPSTLTEMASSGYGTITMAMSNDEIVVTSADSEFTSLVNLDDNQNSSAWWVSASEIRFKPYPLSGWGTIEAEIVDKGDGNA